MQSVIISANEANQRFDKFLHKYIPNAGSGFLHKMLRKKNILLNDAKAVGSEKLSIGDRVTFYFSDETMDKFRGTLDDLKSASYNSAYQKWNQKIEVVYEDEAIIIFNKPAGILSQKALEEDLSANEYLIGYMLANKNITLEELSTFKPSVCNRLDRNTSGLLLCGKTLSGLQMLSDIIKEHKIRKFYRCLVAGCLKEDQVLDGYFEKDEKTNRVTISKLPTEHMDKIKTAYHPIKQYTNTTLLEVELFTGKTHQIRAHLASIGNPIIGDFKYGNSKMNYFYQEKYHLEAQLLHAYRLEFPKMNQEFSKLSDMIVVAPIPKLFETIIKGEESK